MKKAPQLNQLYLGIGVSLWGTEYDLPLLKEKELSAIRKCGLYTMVDFVQVEFRTEPALTKVMSLTLEGVKYYTQNKLSKDFKQMWKPLSKKDVLSLFEKEYNTAFQKEQREISGKLDGQLTEKVLDKYMNMDTDLFDSDDLNDIIDRIDNEKPKNKKQKSKS